MSPPQHTMILKECPKVYVHETHRSRTPQATLDFIEKMKELIGIRSMGEATGADRIGIPVFTCRRTRPDKAVVTHVGKGLSALQAQVSLLMEAIERHASEFRDEYLSRLIRGSFQELVRDHPVLDPQELILPRFAKNPRRIPLHWVWGYDLLAKEGVLVPACAVYHPFPLDPLSPISTSTNGLASGNTMEEAIFHGLAEVVERDAWSIAKFRDSMDTALCVEDIPDHGFLLDLVARFQAASIEITAKDITTNLGIPVIAAFSRDLQYASAIPVDGFGAHLDPCVAMARALMEIASTRAFLLERHGIQGLRQSTSYIDLEAELEDGRFSGRVCKPLGTIESSSTPDILSDIEVMAGRLQEKGIRRIIAVDLTRPDVAIPAVRVIVPGLEVYCFDRSRRGDRLYIHEEEIA